MPRNWGANITNITLVASMSAEGMGPSLAVEGATTREVFEAYLEHLLVPALRPGQVVVMDNLSSHKGSHVRQLIEGRVCKLLYLPPYSPDLKARSRKPSRRSRHCCEAPQRVPVKPWSRGDGRSTERDHSPGRPRLLRPPRLPHTRSTAVTDALGLKHALIQTTSWKVAFSQEVRVQDAEWISFQAVGEAHSSAPTN